jgi:hypothetical protein
LFFGDREDGAGIKLTHSTIFSDVSISDSSLPRIAAIFEPAPAGPVSIVATAVRWSHGHEKICRRSKRLISGINRKPRFVDDCNIIRAKGV